MISARVVRLLFAVLLAAAGAGSFTTQAQEATPSIDGEASLEVVAGGLTNPRGMTWGSDGTLFVALAGSAGTNPPTEEAPTTNAVGPWTGGLTAAVAQIGADGCPVLVAGGLPSTVNAHGEILGVDDVAILGDHLYAAVDGGGPVHGNPDTPSGVYRILGDGTAELLADLSAWSRANPVAEVPGDYDPDAAGYSMIADEATGLLWVVDPNAGQILSVSPDGAVARIADLSVGHPVPTRIVLAPDGGVYVGTLTDLPYVDGAANVLHVAPDGTVTEAWAGLTAVADVAIGPDGELYVLELSTGNLDEAPFFVPESGRVVRQAGPDQHEVIAEGLMFPVALDVGPDGAMYVASPAFGADEGEGVIQRLAMDGEAAAPAVDASACSPLPETMAPSEADSADAAAEEPDGEEPQEPADVAGVVSIVNFTFEPQVLEIPAGTTVTWTNNDTSAHTATASDGAWDTGNIDPGAAASIVFDVPGTYAYICAYHPNMTGTIIVV